MYLIGPGTILKHRFKFIQKIGQGSFGEIYSAEDLVNQGLVAVKLERWDSQKAVLRSEVQVLRKLQASPYVCRYIFCGNCEEHNFLVMELLGDSLSELRRRRPDGCFSAHTTARCHFPSTPPRIPPKFIRLASSICSISTLGRSHPRAAAQPGGADGAGAGGDPRGRLPPPRREALQLRHGQGLPPPSDPSSRPPHSHVGF